MARFLLSAIAALCLAGCASAGGAAQQAAVVATGAESAATSLGEEASGPTGSPAYSAPPAAPDAIVQHTAEGAVAFTEHVVAVFNYAISTPRLEPWQALAADSCGFCSAISSEIAGLLDGGLHRTGGGITFRSASIAYQPESQLYFVDGEVQLASSQDRNSQGEVKSSAAAKSFAATFVVGLEDGEWQLFEAGGKSK